MIYDLNSQIYYNPQKNHKKENTKQNDWFKHQIHFLWMLNVQDVSKCMLIILLFVFFIQFIC